MNAAIYSRFSTDRQSEGEAGSIAQQIAIASDCASRYGYTVVAQYKDEGISGAALGNRPGLKGALDAAERGAFEVLIVADLSRLSRSQADLPRVIERLTFKGVRVLGAQDGFDSSREDSELSAGLHGILGQQFRKMIAARVRSALKMKSENGHRAGGKPYGYRCEDGNGGRRLVIDADQAPIVQEIFERYAAGEGSRDIAMDLNARTIPSPGALWVRTKRRKDGRWLNSGVYALLQNEIYRGESIWNQSRWSKDPDSGLRRRFERPRSEWIVKSMPELRIVSDELWRSVQQRIHARIETFAIGQTARSRRGGVPRHLLTGLLECAECGSKLIVSGSTYGRYICSSFRNGGAHACSNSVTAKKVVADQLMLEGIRTKLLDPEAVKFYAIEYAKAARAQEADAPVAGKRSTKAMKLDQQITDLEQMLRDGRLSPAIAGAALAQAKAERQEIIEDSVIDQEKKQVKVVRMFPHAADILREQVAHLADELRKPEIVQRARPLVHRLCGGRVPVWPDATRSHLIAEVSWNAAPLLMAAGADLRASVGSGGMLQSQKSLIFLKT